MCISQISELTNDAVKIISRQEGKTIKYVNTAPS